MKMKKKEGYKMTMILALFGVIALGLLTANTIAGYALETICANA